jgi:phycocyanobilin:ferredoxin oxidoreductase
MQVDSLIDEYSSKFINTISNLKNVKEIPTENWGWDNHRWESDNFRLAHVEVYNLDNLKVLHTTVFPHKNNTSPIYGFDVICSTKQNSIIGAFIDLSPTISDEWEHTFSSTSTRILPEWADMFSENFIALKNPTVDEWENIFQFAYNLFLEYMNILPIFNTDDDNLITTVMEAQNYYCHQQQQNKRTFGALKSKIGNDRAKLFIETILFPKINTDEL